MTDKRTTDFISEGFNVLKQISAPYLAELKNFHFSVRNPLLWIFFVLAWVILAVRWNYKKAFSYCLMITVVLLATTQIEKIIVRSLDDNALIDFTLPKIICGLVIVFISIYYFMIRGD